ncbi:MAG: hypothetical protein J6M24_02430 [Lachnospiraceae bacterium]|nr:hypothetical protein [Lachnospiraceae bacterium]
MMKKKYFVILSLLAIVIVMITMIVINKKSIIPKRICCTVERILEKEGISGCKITQIANYSDISYFLLCPIVTESDEIQYIWDMFDLDNKELLTDDFVLSNTEFTSKDDFWEDANDKILKNKKISLVIDTRKQIMDRLIESSLFEIDEEEAVNFAVNYVADYENEARIYGMSLDEYRENVLKKSEQEFYNLCYDEGIRQIKEYLVIGAIYQKEFFEDEEIDDDIYYRFQQIQNKVYSLFISTEDGF